MNSLLLKLVSVLLIATCLCACAGGKTPSETDDSSDVSSSSKDTETEELKPFEELEGADYNGYKFVFYTRNCCDIHSDGLFPDEEDIDIVSEACYLRNDKVRELLNVEIVEPLTAPDGYAADIITALQAGEDVCDAISWHMRWLAQMAPSGLLLNMSGLDYLEFDKAWWCSDVIDNYSVRGNVFVAQGYYGLDAIADFACIAFNKTKLADYFSGVDLYEEVRSNKWTLDRMTELVKSYGRDVNDDGVYDAVSDELGLSISRDTLFQFMVSSGQNVSNVDSEGNFELVLNTQKTVSIVEKVYDLVIKNDSTFISDVYAETFTPFVEGRALFFSASFQSLLDQRFRDMSDGYGVIPFPLYNEAQEKYYSGSTSHSALVAIPYTVENSNRSAHVLEAMARGGYEYVNHEFYERALKHKYADDDSAEMMDIITQGATSDFNSIYGEYDLYFTLDILVGINKSSNFSSYYAENETKVKTSVEKALKALNKWIDNNG